MNTVLSQRLLRLLFTLFLGFSVAVGQEDLEKGKALLERGDVDNAIAAFKRALAVSPRSGPVNYYLGLAYVQKKVLDSAESYFRTAVK